MPLEALVEDNPELECSPPFTEKGVRVNSGKGHVSEKKRIKAGYLTACSRPLLSLIPLRRRRVPQSLNLQHAIYRACIGMQLDYLSVTQYDKTSDGAHTGKNTCEAPEIATSIRLH